MPFSINASHIQSLIATPSLDISCFSNKKNLSLEDCAMLINSNEHEQCARIAQNITRSRFGNVKFSYIPLYLSNECVNECVYCGFNVHNKLKRKTLTREEIKKELTAIYQQGFRSILLVSGEVNIPKWRTYFTDAIRIARDIGFHSIAVEIGILDEDTASEIVKSGAETFVVYQETYHRETYKKLHGKGPKSDYDKRINALEIALNAGFRRVTMGFLGGLYDPKFESLALCEHVFYLKKKFWDREFSMSIPRITKAHNVTAESYQLNNMLFAQLLMSLRIIFPEAGLLLSTRESSHFRDGMINICISHLSIASKTSPGGYAECADQLEQFATNDNRSVTEISAILKKNGYDLCFKDWEQELSIRQ